MFNYFLFFLIFFHLLIINKEGFMVNLNKTDKPDNTKFLPTKYFKKLRNRNIEKKTLSPTEYITTKKEIYNDDNNFLYRNIKKINDSVGNKKLPEYFNSPITDQTSLFSPDYKTLFDYKIIRDEIENKKELLEIESENDKKIAIDLEYYHSEPTNNIKIILPEKINDEILKTREIVNNIADGIYKGKGRGI